jgi:hypothetical protein
LRIEEKKAGEKIGDLIPYGLPHWITYRGRILVFLLTLKLLFPSIPVYSIYSGLFASLLYKF